MTTDDATLRKLAEAAPKNWRLRKSRHGPRYAWVSWGRPEEGLGTADLDVPAARYIAAVDPQTILALLDRQPSVEDMAEALWNGDVSGLPWARVGDATRDEYTTRAAALHARLYGQVKS